MSPSQTSLQVDMEQQNLYGWLGPPSSTVTPCRDPVKHLAKTHRYAVCCISSLAKQVI